LLPWSAIPTSSLYTVRHWSVDAILSKRHYISITCSIV
jgi:hypothetical protein